MQATELPTPAQIRQECWRIQESWSPAERRRRAGCYADAEVVRFLMVRDSELDFLPALEHTAGS